MAGDDDDFDAEFAAYEQRAREAEAAPAEGGYDSPHLTSRLPPAGEGEDHAPVVPAAERREPSQEPDPVRRYFAEQQHQPAPGQQDRQPQQGGYDTDPVGHLQRTVENMELDRMVQEHNARHHAALDGWLQDSEATARAETDGDYDRAVGFLAENHRQRLAKELPDNSREAQLLAHSHGLTVPQLREAVFRRDQQLVLDWAIQNRRDPAHTYYELAKSRGFKSSVALTRSQRQALMKAQGDDFDKAWDAYAKASRRVEQRR
jgi:hypothetical protein